MNRRASAVLATLLAVSALSSCATFNRNDVAVKVDDRSLSPRDAEDLVGPGVEPASGDQLRGTLTAWILVQLLGEQARTEYQSGLSSSPLACLAAIPLASPDDADEVLAALSSGTSFADAAAQFSSDPALAQSGGVVSVNGGECLETASLAPAVSDPLASVPVGQPVRADLDSFSAVLQLRPFDDLQLQSQSAVASALLDEDQLATVLDAAQIYVDPRYGRWDQPSHSVVPLSS